MAVYTATRLMKYNIGRVKSYGLALVIEFPKANQNVYRDLETELLSNAKQIPTTQPMLANSEGYKSYLWTINNNKNLLIIKSDKDFTFISNELFIEGTIINDNLDIWGEEFNGLHEVKLEDFIIEVILVFKNEDRDTKDSCLIFNINTTDVIKSKNSIYRFLPISQWGFDE